MMTRFRVKNYKSLKDVEIPLTPFHVLIGKNDSGKTSLLEAIYAILKAGEKDATIQDGFPFVWDNRELVFHGCKDGTVSFDIQFANTAMMPASNTLRYAVQMQFSHSNRNIKRTNEWLGDRCLDDLGFAPLMNKTCLSELRRLEEGGADLLLLASRIGQVASYQFEPKAMSLASALDVPTRFSLDRDGFGLPNLLDDIVNHGPERFLELERSFSDFFPHFTKIRLEKARGVVRRYSSPGVLATTGEGIGKEIVLVDRTGASTKLKHASDGVVLLLGFLALTFVPEPPNVILVEEPENGVYPKRLSDLIGMMKQLIQQHASRSLQFILTTHSPYMLSDLEPEEVTFM